MPSLHTHASSGSFKHMGPMCFPRPLCRECWRLDPKGRAPMAAAAGACLHAGAACRPASPSWSSPAGCVFQASCQATEVVIAHLQPQMGNVERLHCEARDSWRMASPQASSNARGPDVRMCVSKAADCSGLVSSLCGVLALKGALGLSLLLQELVQKAALSLHDRERRKC